MQRSLVFRLQMRPGLPAAGIAAALIAGSALRGAPPARAGEPADSVSQGAADTLRAGVPREGLHTVRAEVVLSYEREGDRRTVLEGSLSAESPDRMRLNTHLGLITAFELTARGDSFWVTIPHYSAILAGRKDQVRVTPLDPARLTQALFLAPLSPPSGTARSDSGVAAPETTGVEATGYWITGLDSLGDYRMRMDNRDRPLVFTRTRTGAPAPFLEIDFERYSTVRGGSYPLRIRWRDLEQRQSLTMDFDGAELNAELEQRGFGPPRETGSRIIQWSSWEALLSAGP